MYVGSGVFLKANLVLMGVYMPVLRSVTRVKAKGVERLKNSMTYFMDTPN